jgi:pantoate--beta-alanine ligase
MLVFTLEEDLINHLSTQKKNGKTLVFVPTMGALHLGHLSLIEKSSLENNLTVVSIFVNPIQFNNPSDLKNYPRTLDEDLIAIKSVNPNAIVFTPSEKSIFKDKPTNLKFNFKGLDQYMEGSSRPGHFNGVGTIVHILFNIVKPNNAYFGEKDYQQLLIIKQVNQQFKHQINIIGCPIYRETHGLAMSSRNERLSAVARQKSSIIYDCLKTIHQEFSKKSIPELKILAENIFEKHPEFKLEYLEICNADTLKPVKRKNNATKYRAFIAVQIENVRLIDNISVN